MKGLNFMDITSISASSSSSSSSSLFLPVYRAALPSVLASAGRVAPHSSSGQRDDGDVKTSGGIQNIQRMYPETSLCRYHGPLAGMEAIVWP